MVITMRKTTRTVLAAVLASWTLGAQAWWGPFFGWFDDFFGGGNAGFDFSVSMHGNAGGWGRYYDYGGPYGHPYWGHPSVQGYPYAPSPQVTGAQLGSESQTRQLRRDVEAQRLLADRMAKQQDKVERKPPVSTVDPFSGFDPFSMDAAPAVESVSPRDLDRMIKSSASDTAVRKPASILADSD
jgi:hypothetical protein